ncbi:MAG: DUF4172 domain-containing protein [Fibrobacter sp.]|nr:DUF4172 domain-containing protein [Fibrobacter sp.]
MLYIHQYPDWTRFRYDHKHVINALGEVRKAQGKLIAMAQICNGADMEQQILLQEMVDNAAIDGIQLHADDLKKAMDNIQATDKPISAESLLSWHASIMQTGTSRFRTLDSELRCSLGEKQLSFSGPHHETLFQQVTNFTTWVSIANLDGIIKAAISHFWLLTLRPFARGNGRVTRMITAMELSKSSDGAPYLYPINTQILEKKDEYFDILNRTQKGSGDITEWILWFLNILQQSIEKSLAKLTERADKIRFQQRFANIALSIREQTIVDAVSTGKLPQQFSAKDVGALLSASHDTALREIQSLIAKGVFKAAAKGGRSQRYCLAE